jgi:class 3 adenylate cyclase
MERKLATALFVDLVDSTALVSGSDPEIVRRRVTGFFDRAAAQIAAYGGTVEKFAGDAVVAVFGVPIAHEDDAERAVRAAVAILETCRGDLPVRIGIEAGEVVAETATRLRDRQASTSPRASTVRGEILIGRPPAGCGRPRDSRSVGDRTLRG